MAPISICGKALPPFNYIPYVDKLNGGVFFPIGNNNGLRHTFVDTQHPTRRRGRPPPPPPPFIGL